MTTSLTVHDVPLTLNDQGTGRPVLLLHGGGGPATVQPWADRLAASHDVRVLTPVHPGFAGTPRPAPLTSIRDLAALYTALLEQLDLREVTVVGNSLGGWTAAEMALLASERCTGHVIVDGVGIEVPGHPIADFFSLTPAEVAARSFADPATYFVDPASLPQSVRDTLPGNRAALALYGGPSMSDATLLDRLSDARSQVLVVWGEADRICHPDYGRAYADAIPGAAFSLIPEAGHLPQIERPEHLTTLVRDFLARPQARTA
ncbi:alpha/beta fold hydrolase [Streptomyces lichenis]|uniref:Alpha/beta hydrolase n=1 Tax=Streptomyces lichenis TaxID=2306967 RepID=A0ABT0I9X6_9ACTN|nr:alpha/beta hydrolase [Streptomyces lichenis]MCK8678127.1 alpha/beta hydrolase [Streptomyces lichenis]